MKEIKQIEENNINILPSRSTLIFFVYKNTTTENTRYSKYDKYVVYGLKALEKNDDKTDKKNVNNNITLVKFLDGKIPIMCQSLIFF